VSARKPLKGGTHVVYWIIVAVFVGIGVALFVLPHHKGDFEFASLARDLGEVFDGTAAEGPGVLVFQGLAILGSVGVFMPAVQAIAIALASPESSRKVLIAGGVLLVLGSILTFFVEVLSNVSFGWGGGSRYKMETPVAYLAPLFPFLCGVASIVMGAMRVRLPWR
jgi:hypothetical protein